MAFFLNKTTMFSGFKSHSQQKTEDPFLLSRRGLHIEPGSREKALLEEDPALKRFKSHKRSVWQLKRIGDVLTIVVVAEKERVAELYNLSWEQYVLMICSYKDNRTGCCYEIYVKAVMREEARK